MRSTACLTALAATLSALPAPAMAQDDAADVAAMRAEIARLRAQLEQLEGRLNKVETQAAAVPPAPPVATPAAPPKQVAEAAAPETSISWRGAPQFSNGKGLTFKPRGRLQLDSNYVTRPAGATVATLGWSADIRRAFLGVEGAFGGGLGYRLELDFANGTQFTDTWLTYETGPVTFTLGHHRLTDLEDLTSDLETSFLERSSFVTAFAFERRLGLSATFAKGDIVYSAGIFSDDLETLGSGVTDDSFSIDTRLVYMPKIGDAQLHLAGSMHHRELQGLLAPLRYRARPGARTTDVRFLDTGAFSATSETGYGVEFAAIRGPFHVASEAFWQHVDRPNFSDPTFFGAYGEVGYVFAGARSRGYSKGSFSSIRPTAGIDKGGSGAWQVNLRYDWLDLNDASVRGGTQRTLGASLVWVPIEHVKFLANYLRLSVDDTPVLVGALDHYDVNVFGLRAQYDF